MRGLRVALLAVALLQLTVAALILFREEIRIPDWVTRSVAARFEANGIAATWQRLRVDITGRIFIDAPDLRNAATGERVFRARSLYAEVSLFHTLFGLRSPLETIRVTDGELFLPAMLSASGTDAPVISGIQLHLHLQPGELLVDNLVAHSGPIALQLSGSTKLPTSSHSTENERHTGSPTAAAPPSTWIDRFYQAAAHLATLPKLTENIDDATVVLRLRTAPDRATSASLDLTAARLRLPGSVTLEQLRLHADDIDLLARSLRGPLHAWVASARVADTALLHRISARLEGALMPLGPVELRRKLVLGAASLDIFDMRLDTPRIRVDLAPQNHTTAEFRVLARGAPVAGHLRFNPSDRSARIDLDSRANPVDWFDHPAVRDLSGLRETVRAIGSIALKARVNLGAGLRFRDAAFGARVDNLDIKGSTFRHARLRGHIDRHALIAHEIEALLPDGQHARGAFVQHFAPLDYRILGTGAIHPQILHPILGTWWHHLWRNMSTTPGNPAAASVDVAGRWRDTDRTTALVRAQVHNARYKDTPVDRATVEVRHATGFVTVAPLIAHSGDGSLRGRIEWLYPRDKTRGIIEAYDLDSRLDFPRLCVLLGDTGTALAEVLHAEGRPHVSIRGTLEAIPGDPPAHREDLTIEVDTDAALRVGRFPFERARARAHLRDDRLELAPLEVGFLGGRGSGTVAIERITDPHSPLSFDMAFRGVDFRGAARLLDPAHAEANADPSIRTGIIDLSARGASTDRTRIDAWTATGSVAVRDTELHRLRLFGPLSRLLDSVGIGITSFSLNRFTSDVALAAGKLRFERGHLEGATMRIEASGFYDLSTDALDFDLKTFLLDPLKPNLTSIFGLLLRPLGHVLELRMSGTFDKPEWRFRYDPRNLLRAPATEPPAPAPQPAPPAP